MDKVSLKSARVNKGLTQEEFAKLMGVHRNTVASWESDSKNMSIQEAEKACDVLDKKFEQIFFD